MVHCQSRNKFVHSLESVVTCQHNYRQKVEFLCLERSWFIKNIDVLHAMRNPCSEMNLFQPSINRRKNFKNFEIILKKKLWHFHITMLVKWLDNNYRNFNQFIFVSVESKPRNSRRNRLRIYWSYEEGFMENIEISNIQIDKICILTSWVICSQIQCTFNRR